MAGGGSEGSEGGAQEESGGGAAARTAGGDEAAGWSCVRTFTGHTNFRNFVGLGVCSPFVACGSETNEVCVYYKGVTHPVLQVPLVPPGSRPGGAGGSGGGTSGSGGNGPAHFVSAVCWRGPAGGCGDQDASTLLAANSQGGIFLLSLS